MPESGTGKGCGSSKILSGLGMPQPSTKVAGAGMSAGSPCRVPELAQARIVLISFSVSERSFAKCPMAGSAYQGGIRFCFTASFMVAAQGRACSYVMSGKGAASPGRWQVWQCCWRIVATSLVKVTAGVPGLWQKEYAFIEMSAAAIVESVRPMDLVLEEQSRFGFEKRVYRDRERSRDRSRRIDQGAAGFDRDAEGVGTARDKSRVRVRFAHDRRCRRLQRQVDRSGRDAERQDADKAGVHFP